MKERQDGILLTNPWMTPRSTKPSLEAKADLLDLNLSQESAL